MTVEGTQFEGVTVGGEMRFREGNGSWQCGPPQGRAAIVAGIRPENFALLDPALAEVTTSKGPAATIDGVQTQSYAATVKETGTEDVNRWRIYIETASGLLKRMETVNEAGAVEYMGTFSDYNANISITLPPCK